MYDPYPGEGLAAELRGRLKILIVDDHPGTRRALQLVLRWLRCGAELAENGREAVEALRGGDYDLVFMDVAMSQMDGIAATRQIRMERAYDAGPRIVGMSADAGPDDQECCFAAGMDDFLAKPIDLDALIRILDGVAQGVAAVC
jgi:CheY-like chemotaxis protein